MVFAHRALFDRRRQRRQLRRQRRTGQCASRPDPGREPEPAGDFFGREAKPRPQHAAHLWYQPGAVGRIGDLREEPVHQAPVGALLGLQPVGHVHPEVVADHIG